ncbi:MAG: alpha/beta fold hydrolase [Acidobacteriaceae bacterium]|nr:alpha/beta fold hydrolase [Acidobacteriaceae bacterium]
MPYVNSDGIRLYWKEHGSGPPVLLIMGLSFTHEMWYRVLPALTSRCRVILFDNRGMGLSDVPTGPYTIRQMARDAAAVLDAARVPAAHVIGASMGGMIAQELALTYPTRVLSLVLACTSHGALLARWPRFVRPRGIKWGEAERRARELALAPLLYAPSTPLDRIHEDLEVQCRSNWTYKGFLNQFSGILLWSSYRRLPSIRVPTLVVHGDRDCLIPHQNGRVVASRIPGARFRLIENAGHILTTDQPEACTRIMVEFVRQIRGTSNFEPGTTCSSLPPAATAPARATTP